ncbi:hypothetical protein BG011_010276 [Mortierella polycephala]|uniref:SET domain-containing protein n=1 Tax=Mortierella polycephala TaxID=41804 RepID=A0A9P6PMG0_9FUNG|nr:hypothetical protein BG011_010276 [Mortierella polycephala]
MSSKDLSAFLAWAEKNDIIWDKSLIEIKEGKHGLGVYAKKKLEAGYEVVQVPKSIVLSVETTAIANILEDEEVNGYVGLIIGCMYEMSCGALSPWSPYLQLLAKRGPPPMATGLSKKSRELMKYCEAYNDIESDISDIQDDYDSVLVPFIEKYPEVFTKEIRAQYFSLEAFKTMTAHVVTRAMDVDNFHVTALVPFADFVNHSSMPNADYLAHEDVCEVCGALVCEHREYEDDEDDDMESDSEQEDDDEEDDDEVPELTSGGKDDSASSKDTKKKQSQDEEDSAEGEEWEDEDEEDDDDEDDDDEEVNDTCDITLDTDVKKGEEITRHYGAYPNKILLCKYGFAIEGNPHDTVTIQLEMVRQAAEKIVKDEALVEKRIQWFLEHEDEFIGEDGEGDHEHDDDESMEDAHEHSAGGGCCGPKNSGKNGMKKGTTDDAAEDDDQEDMETDDEDEDEEEEEAFPRDIMYMMHDGSVDDRLLMLLNVLFMDKATFAKLHEDMESAMKYFNDIFIRRQQEEHSDEDEEMESDDNEDVEKLSPPELKPRDKNSKQVRKRVLEAILALIHIRAEAFGVSVKTTAEQDLASLKKAKLPGPLYYGGLCVQGEKQILQNGLQGYEHFLSEL